MRLVVDALLGGCCLICLLRCLSLLGELKTKGYIVDRRNRIPRRLIPERDMKTIVAQICLYAVSSAGYLLALLVWDALFGQLLGS